MHEAAIAQNIIQAVEQRLAQGDISGRVAKVFLQVGRLRGVVAENLKFLFGVLAQGTKLDGVLLEVESVPIRASCADCQASMEIEELFFRCSRCGSGRLRMLSGDELQISAVEVE